MPNPGLGFVTGDAFCWKVGKVLFYALSSSYNALRVLLSRKRDIDEI